MMKTKLLMAAIAVLMTAGCSKDAIIPIGKNLGHRYVDACEGSFPVAVSTEGYWSAKSISKWISVTPGFQKGKGAFEVLYESNESMEWDVRFNRRGIVLISTYDGATVDTLEVWQKGVSPFVLFDDEYFVDRKAAECSVPMVTNLTDYERRRVAFTSDTPWITDVMWGLDGRSVSFRVSEGSSRSALITFSHTDEWGIKTERKFKVTQK